MIRSNPSPLPDNVLKLIAAWEKREKSKLFGYITTRQWPPPTLQINRSIARLIRTECADLKKIEMLDILLDCGGGDADAAFQIITFLQSKCERLRIFVPDWAKSAATLMCLGADEIWMSNVAELGPLDAQILDPRNPQEMPVSALEQFGAMDYLKTYSFEMLDTFIVLLIENLPSMRIKNMIPEATDFVTKQMSALYGQVDPFHFGGSYRSLAVAVEYGKRLMGRYGYSDWKLDQINAVINKLTWEYPSHSFVIDMYEAKTLGLHIQLLDGNREKEAHSILKDIMNWIGFAKNSK
ncbi:MAG: hypothetical protein FVQ83_06940 [Chloroflexi bacterium]|nr:hypothetical protein [Chloroflexota bacterium]